MDQPGSTAVQMGTASGAEGSSGAAAVASTSNGQALRTNGVSSDGHHSASAGGHSVGSAQAGPSHQQPGPAAQPRPKRRRITPEQLQTLTTVFAEQDTPGYELREKLSLQLNMSVREVQNRRAKINRERLATQQQQQIEAQRRQLEEQARSLQTAREAGDGVSSPADGSSSSERTRGDRSRPHSANQAQTAFGFASAPPPRVGTPGNVYNFSPSQASLAFGPGGALYAYTPPVQQIPPQPYYMPIYSTATAHIPLERSPAPHIARPVSLPPPEPPALLRPLDQIAKAAGAGTPSPHSPVPSPLPPHGLTLPPLRSLAFGLPNTVQSTTARQTADTAAARSRDRTSGANTVIGQYRLLSSVSIHFLVDDISGLIVQILEPAHSHTLRFSLSHALKNLVQIP